MQYNAASSQAQGPRSEQQDAFLSTPDVLCIADGMGGYAGGSKASAEVIKSVNNMLPHVPPQAADSAVERILAITWLSDIITDSNTEICRQQLASVRLAKMGSTVVLALRMGNRLHYAHVGDSRLYLLRSGKLQQLTTDHSFSRNVLSRVVGRNPQYQADHGVLDLKAHDVVMLCSDGVYGVLSDQDIIKALTAANAQQMCDDLIKAAAAASTTDNSTAVVLVVNP